LLYFIGQGLVSLRVGRVPPHDLTDNVLSGFASPRLQSRLDAIASADAIVVSTPIYSASYSGLFKMLVDVLPQESLRGKPVLLAATGGTARHSLAIDHALRPLFAYFGALVAPVAVFAASEDWGSAEAGRLGERIDRAGAEFAALLTGAPAPRQVDPFESVTPFETMLSQVSHA
jgi:FMN reductase